VLKGYFHSLTNTPAGATGISIEQFKDFNTPGTLGSSTYPICYDTTHYNKLGWSITDDLFLIITDKVVQERAHFDRLVRCVGSDKMAEVVDEL